MLIAGPIISNEFIYHNKTIGCAMFNFLVKGMITPVLIVVGLAQSVSAAQFPVVFVSILPQKFFVQQIGKELVDVEVMVQPGASPATYEPKPKQMAALSRARIYFSIGVPFENAWLRKISATNPEMKVVHTDQGITKIPMAAHHDEEDGSRHEDRHSRDQHAHGTLDPHIWLSPSLVKIQAQTILEALQEIDPEHAGIYEDNFRQFVSAVDALDTRLKAVFAAKDGMRFMVFHPSWGYFAEAYGLQQIPIEVEGKNPKPAQLKALIEHARENKISVVFVQPQFSTKSAELIAREIGGQVVFADPLAENWLDNLYDVASKFKAALN
jgi:zinc transport system substrate-binding protein